jgi:hypothetical protein
VGWVEEESELVISTDDAFEGVGLISMWKVVEGNRAECARHRALFIHQGGYNIWKHIQYYGGLLYHVTSYHLYIVNTR